MDVPQGGGNTVRCKTLHLICRTCQMMSDPSRSRFASVMLRRSRTAAKNLLSKRDLSLALGVPSGRSLVPVSFCLHLSLSVGSKLDFYTLTKRTWVACRGRDGGPSAFASGSRVLAGLVASTSSPTLSNHKVATATANHNRAARCGSLMRVRCPCQPPRWVILKPGSLHARKPYPHASPARGARAVRNNPGSA
jgi:hypothetical protein